MPRFGALALRGEIRIKRTEKAKAQPPASSGARRKCDPERTRRNVLDVARQAFFARGLSGARGRHRQRMLYHCFGRKQGLYDRAPDPMTLIRLLACYARRLLVAGGWGGDGGGMFSPATVVWAAS
jgi:hypothetical protein